MSHMELLHDYLCEQLAGKVTQIKRCPVAGLTLEVPGDNWLEVANFLRHDELTQFTQLMDLCGVDYLTYGRDDWDVTAASATGFSRAVEDVGEPDPFAFDVEESRHAAADFQGRRYAVVVHLLSISKNTRLRLRTWCEDNDRPMLPSLVGIWSSANWYEREAFDLFGILFNNHPDLRRILTDYGFIGHPFRKDFPLTGQVEMRYDTEQQRVVYEPVSIEPRVLVPRVIRAAHEEKNKLNGEGED